MFLLLTIAPLSASPPPFCRYAAEGRAPLLGKAGSRGQDRQGRGRRGQARGRRGRCQGQARRGRGHGRWVPQLVDGFCVCLINLTGHTLALEMASGPDF